MSKWIKAKLWVNWHNKLGWWSLTAIFIWVLSGASHPLMSWLGPKADKFFPPSMELKANDLRALPDFMNPQQLKGAKIVKVVPTSTGPLLQVTRDLSQAKQYLSLETGQEIIGYDKLQATWLAGYYSGRSESEIEEVTFITEFSSAYPWVNRLLPVYNIRYKGSDSLSVFVHTETSALASLTNNTKSTMQWFFQHLHTFKFLETVEWGRLVIASLFMITLCLMALIGLGLIFLLKSRKIKNSSRRYHRIFSYVLWFPLLMWSASGFYHLLQSSIIASPSGLRLGNSYSFEKGVSKDTAWVEQLQGKKLNSLALVKYQNSLFYRVSVSPVQQNITGKPISRRQRFAGVPTEMQSIYVKATTGRIDSQLTDSEFSKHLAVELSGMPESKIQNVDLVTRYGPKYDFRNKRLPVWRVTFNDSDGSNVFIDPSTGLLVDQSRSIDRLERWSFSNLHKWNFMSPLTGRFLRDVFILTTLALLFMISIFGAVLLLKRRGR